MNSKEIKLQYKKTLKKLKWEYKKNKKDIKNQYEIDMNSNVSVKLKDAPFRFLLEEIGNAISHGLGAILSIVALIFMLIKSTNSVMVLASLVYFFGLFIMFISSCLYHSFKYATKVKRLFRRFDYCSIYLLIGATFAPILLLYVDNTFGLIFFILQWVIIITGITFVSVFGVNRFKAMHFTLYILLGWSGLIFLPKMFSENFNFLLFILGGGVVYTLGIIPFSINKKVMHFLWHLFVLLGAIVQFIGIYINLYS